MSTQPYISLRDAARLLNVSQSTGRRAFYRSGVEGIRAAGAVLVRSADLDKIAQYVEFGHPNCAVNYKKKKSK